MGTRVACRYKTSPSFLTGSGPRLPAFVHVPLRRRAVVAPRLVHGTTQQTQVRQCWLELPMPAYQGLLTIYRIVASLFAEVFANMQLYCLTGIVVFNVLSDLVIQLVIWDFARLIRFSEPTNPVSGTSLYNFFTKPSPRSCKRCYRPGAHGGHARCRRRARDRNYPARVASRRTARLTRLC